MSDEREAIGSAGHTDDSADMKIPEGKLHENSSESNEGSEKISDKSKQDCSLLSTPVQNSNECPKELYDDGGGGGNGESVENLCETYKEVLKSDELSDHHNAIEHSNENLSELGDSELLNKDIHELESTEDCDMAATAVRSAVRNTVRNERMVDSGAVFGSYYDFNCSCVSFLSAQHVVISVEFRSPRS